MRPVLVRSALRELRRHPLQSALAVVGVALGVAVALAIQLASSASLRAMELSARAAGGRATHAIVAGPGGLHDSTFARVRIELGVRPSAPILEEHVPLLDRPGEVLRLIGVDPFCDAPFREYLGAAGLGIDLAAFFAEPGSVWLAADTATRLGYAVGDTLPIAVGATRPVARLAGLLAPTDPLQARLTTDLMVTDIATAQELLGLEGQLSRIDLLLDGTDAAEEERFLAALRRFLPADAEIEESGARAGALAAMTRGFRLNLQALSLLSLVVGLFLVYNAALFSVVRRAASLATLRCLGATRAQVVFVVLGEAALLGLLGSAVGVAGGWALGVGLVRLVTRTINDLYFALQVREIEFAPQLLVGAIALGLATTMVGALAPALEASRADPRGARRRSQVEQRARRGLVRYGAAGTLLAIAGSVLLATAGTRLPLAFGGLFGLIVGAALLVPPIAAGLLALSERPAARLFGAPGALAARGSSRSLSRTSVALAALVVALSTSIAVGVLIASFRTSVITWLDSAFTADVYASTPTLVRTRAASVFPGAAINALLAAPDVDRVVRYRTATAPSPRGPVQLVALDTAIEGAAVFQFQSGGSAGDVEALERGEAFFVTEPLAHHLVLEPGDVLELDLAGGRLALPIAAVVHDYGSDRGNAIVDLSRYQRASGDTSISSLGLWLTKGRDPDAALPELRATLPAGLNVVMRSNAGLRTETLVVFDRTFAVTRVLRFVTLLVALVGLVSALMALALDRAREIAVLRALGLTPGQLYGLLGAQALMLGLVAGLIALPVGALVAFVMIDVVNARSFGWTLLAFEFGPTVVFTSLGLAGSVGWLGSLLPAWMANRLEPSRALRQD